MTFDIVSFGSAVVDTFVNTDVSNKHNFLHYPVGAKLQIKDLKVDVGGGGTNTAVAFARLGLKTGCISAVGDDENGRRILHLLKKEHVTFLGPMRKNNMSGYSVILDSKDKDRTILTFKGVNEDIKEKDIKTFKTRWLYYPSLTKTSFKTQKALAKKLAKHGTKVAFNPGSHHIKHENLTRMLQNTYFLILNKEEAQTLAKKYNKKKDLLLAIADLGPQVVVITDKNNPVRCLYEGKEYNITPHKSVKVVERTGAGDAFAAGVVAGLVANLPIQKCLELGLKESESVIQHFGAKNILLRKKLKKK